MKRIGIAFLLLSTLMIITVAYAAPSQSAEQPRQVVSAGNTSVSVGEISLNGTLGQPFVGSQSIENTTIRHGFWDGIKTSAFVQWLIHLPLVLR